MRPSRPRSCGSCAPRTAPSTMPATARTAPSRRHRDLRRGGARSRPAEARRHRGAAGLAGGGAHPAGAGPHRAGRLERQGGGLQGGADDYLVKPFRVEELVIRLRALVRRPPPPTGPHRDLRSGQLRSRPRRLHPRRAARSSSPASNGGSCPADPAPDGVVPRASCWSGSTRATRRSIRTPSRSSSRACAARSPRPGSRPCAATATGSPRARRRDGLRPDRLVAPAPAPRGAGAIVAALVVAGLAIGLILLARFVRGRSSPGSMRRSSPWSRAGAGPAPPPVARPRRAALRPAGLGLDLAGPARGGVARSAPPPSPGATAALPQVPEAGDDRPRPATARAPAARP